MIANIDQTLNNDDDFTSSPSIIKTMEDVALKETLIGLNNVINSAYASSVENFENHNIVMQPVLKG